jgi:circadian clock protein KaiC
LADSNLIRTGIAGFDDVLLGGIPKGNTIVVKGSAGCGKTLFGMEFIYNGITQFNEPGIIVVFESSPEKLIRDAAGFGWDLEELQSQKKLQIIFTSPQVLDHELRAPDSLLLETAGEMGAQRIFIDGIGLLEQALPTERSFPGLNGAGSFRELMNQVVEGLQRENLAAMFSLEVGLSPRSVANVEVTDYIADTVIHLTRTEKNRRTLRNVEIVKSRGQDYETGLHTLQITSEKGLEVFRRVQSPRQSNKTQPTSSARRSVTGVKALDTLIGGGIFDGSTTLVLGVSGVGKTVLGTHLLREAIKQGSRGLLISLDEHPAQIVRNAATIGLDLQELIDSGSLHIMFESPQELNLDKHFAQIVAMVEKHDIQRMVIDGLTSYSSALGDQTIYRDFFHALVSFSKGRLMTTFLNYENPEFLGVSTFMPDFPVSSIVDNIILLSLVEMENSLHRCITVVKARGSQHEFDSREYTIGKGGINLEPVGSPRGLPRSFSAYSSILSRAPTRLPAALPVGSARPRKTRKPS